MAGEDQRAIWSFTGGIDPYGTLAALLAQAQTAVSGGFTVSGWEILTPDAVPGNRGQEFLLEATIPEPSTILLLLAGLGLAAIVSGFCK
jgi:PEP-CTERM motif